MVQCTALPDKGVLIRVEDAAVYVGIETLSPPSLPLSLSLLLSIYLCLYLLLDHKHFVDG